MSPEIIAERLPDPRRGTVFALIGAPVAWGVQLLGSWLIEGAACHDQHPALALGPAALRVAEIGLLVVTLAVAIAALLAGWRRWSRSRDPEIDRIHAGERPDFMAALA